MRGDRTIAARYFSYPLIVRYPSSGNKKNLRTPAELLGAWDSVFTSPILEAMSTSLLHDMFGYDGMAMLGNGEAWFDQKGLKVLSVPAPLRKKVTH